MLILSLPPAEGALRTSCNQDFTFDRMPVDEYWEGCPHSDKLDQDGCGSLVPMLEKYSNEFSSIILPTSSQISIPNIMSRSPNPLRVYHRKKLHMNSLDICPAQVSGQNKNSDVCHSAYSSEAHSRASKEHLVSVETETVSPCKPVICSIEGLASKSGSFNGCLDGEEPHEGFRHDIGRVRDICCIDDSCSSSKLNLNLVSSSLKTDGDDSGECSSSGGLVSERQWGNMSERDICISIIRSHGFVEIARSVQDCISASDNAMTSDQNCCSRTCKVCGNSETSSKMLICDQCEDAFHTFCCIPRVKRIPVDEWFCYSCLKKKRKILKEKSCNAPSNITNEDELGPIAQMLRDTRPFKSSVRVGHEYQVDVPDWSGPVIAENDISDPEEIKELDLVLHGDDCKKALQLSSIGNWIQCQEVIEGTEEDTDVAICRKWRRAPLFESQTDDWECFQAVLWDPAHADCAVPQELPTDEVLRQLKYIEMLRPRLEAKKRKLDQIKIVDSKAPKAA